jgi:uncharacterized protein YcnI
VTRRLLSALGILALAALTLAGPALAHVQVRPTLVAPGDPVLFEVIVPGERDEPTVEVTLQVPPDVIPFSFEDAPGWERTLNEGSDGSIETITWRGELAPDGFARFSFLASTPEKEGEIVWKALQTYEGGEVVRWIGAADSDNPAAVTKVSNDAPRQNAGGEGGEGADEGAGEPAATPAGGGDDSAPAADSEPAAAERDDGDSPVALILSIIALLLGAAALAVALRGRRPAA